MNELDTILEAAAGCRSSGERCALATVVSVRGSSYRRPGARLLVPEHGTPVGLISGGSGRNIIPEWCTFLAEARSHDQQKLADLVREMLEAVTFAAGLEDCQVETEVHKSYSGYRFKRDDFVVRLARTALERTGFEPAFTLSGGAADANVFNDRGLACVNLANGMAEIHTPDEHIAVSDLERMVDVTLALVDVARETDAP